MKLFDTHCHVHEATLEVGGEDATRSLWVKAGSPDPDGVVAQAVAGGVVGMVCVGTTADDSALAVRFVQDREHCWASVGLHPHEAKGGQGELEKLAALLEASRASSSRLLPAVLAPRGGSAAPGVPSSRPLATKPIAVPPSSSSVEQVHDLVVGDGKHSHSSLRGSGKTLIATGDLRGTPSARSSQERVRMGGALPAGPTTAGVEGNSKIVAIGECGLDYFYSHSPKEDQIKALRYQIEMALKHDLPLIFHVREAFDDFWPILDDYRGVRGVVHSFTDSQANLNNLLDRGLFVGINGIITFTKNEWQLDVARAIPLDHLVLETDAPFLTPAPIRGRVNVPVNVELVANFLAELRGESPDKLAEATTRNAFTIFSLRNTKT